MSQGHFGAPVVTLTPAPTLDRTYYVNNLHPGGVNRADDVREELAGKAVALDFHDDEAMILDWVEGKGKRVGTIGKFMAQDSEGNVFGMPVMDRFKYLQDNFEEMKTWVGKLATFTYFERTKAGSYRHPLFKCIRNYE